MEPNPPERVEGAGSSGESAFAAGLGRAVKVFRTGLGMSRRVLAKRAGLSYSYVTEIENGKKQASASAQKAIATALGMSASALLAAAEEWTGQLGAEAAVEAGETTFAAHTLAESIPTVALKRSFSIDPYRRPREGGARQRQLRWFHDAAREAHASRLATTLEEADLGPPGPDLERALHELRRLLDGLDPEDRQRVIELARRLGEG